MRSRRALLYVPGSDLHKIEKAAGLDVDGIILDLEDGVSANRKDEARGIIAEALKTIDFGRSERLVRINPFYTGRAEADLDAVLPSRPDTLVIPKVDSPGLLARVDEILTRHERLLTLPYNTFEVIALIESAKAFVTLPSICSGSSRLTGLIFGAEDLTADAGMTRTPAGTELLYVRSMMALHAAAFDLQAIDMVQTNFTDIERLTAEARQAADLGYAGKQVIHPAQIVPVQQVFTPDQAAIDHARRIISGADEAAEGGHGAYSLDGEMVDLPVIKRAQKLLARAKAAGMIP
jgi:citrate lyase subunit beta-like protein